MADKKPFKPYRARKKVVAELHAKGEITDMEAKSLNNAIVIADKEAMRGKYFIDLSKYVGAQKQELEEAIKNGRLNNNQKKMVHTLMIYQIEKPYLYNATSIQEAIDKYFQITLESGGKPTINGLSLAIGISKKDLFEIANGKAVYSGSVRVAGETNIKNAIQVIATANEIDIAESGGLGSIFLAKNFFGLSDKKELSISDERSDINEKELKDKYDTIDIIDIDTDDK